MASNRSSTNNIRCILAYKGTHYHGFRKVAAGPSIESELEKVLSMILQRSCTIQAASRTDRGVHAEGQVINFFVPKETNLYKLYASMRSLLPKDIAPLSLDCMPDDFHPTLDVKKKEYHYWVCNCPTQIPFHSDFSWHVYETLDIEAIRQAIPHLTGKKDFTSFSNLFYEDPVRTLEKIHLDLENNRIRFALFGDNFLYKMVRNIIGTLIHVGMGKIPPSSLPHILAKKDRRLCGITAPSHGLFLKRIYY